MRASTMTVALNIRGVGSGECFFSVPVHDYALSFVFIRNEYFKDRFSLIFVLSVFAVHASPFYVREFRSLFICTPNSTNKYNCIRRGHLRGMAT